MLKTRIYILLAFILFACKSTPEAPLSKEKMVTVLTDISIAEGQLRVLNIFGDSAKMVAPVFYDSVYRVHGISREDFLKSYEQYSKDPKTFNEIIDKVLEELSKKESGIE